ncbi:MAG: IPT/TIG domain-containing protein [Acidobacteriota bacterium]|nr:IPT/TIG domain-containing protein [Blastocatellia bacterium]MDW8412193.1 IPT/TIG domain-containing protein [Acidobacteriota bacterium]
MGRLKLVIFLVFIFCVVLANSGVPPLGHTGAPGEQLCNSCHEGAVNSGKGRLVLLNLPTEYVPGNKYRMQLLLDDPDAKSWGMQLTVIGSSGASLGTIEPVDTTVTELRTAQIDGKTRIYLVSTIAGNFTDRPGPVVWDFDWVAPAQPAGTAMFYAAGVASNSDSTVRGDKTYRMSASSRQFEERPLAINFLNPNRGPEGGGTAVVLRGQGFKQGARVTFGGLDAKASFVDSTTLNLISPPHPAGAVPVRVSNPNGDSVTLEAGFTYEPPPPPAPVLRFVSPDSGPTTGGQIVRLGGDNFTQQTTVIWNGRKVPAKYIDVNFLEVTTPKNSPGKIAVSVINPDGQVATLPDAYTYLGDEPPPVVKLLFPTGGEVLSADGETTAIRWQVDSNGKIIQNLYLSTDGGRSYPNVIASRMRPDEDTFKWIIPEDLVSAAARLKIEAVQGGLSVSEQTRDFRIVLAPKITELRPASVYTSVAKVNLVVKGRGFVKGCTVEMNGVKLKTKYVSDTELLVKKLPHSTVGSFLITVRNPDGGVSRPFLFTVGK